MANNATKIEELFLSLGYTEEEINEIKKCYPVSNVKDDTLLKRVKEMHDYLFSFGYTKEEIIRITITLPQIYSLTIGNINNKIKMLY